MSLSLLAEWSYGQVRKNVVNRGDEKNGLIPMMNSTDPGTLRERWTGTIGRAE